jgi:chitinase
LSFSTAYGLQGSATGKARKTKVAAAWYAGWHADAGFPLSDVSWSKYTHLTYSFA